jgi:hypothetical protein
MGDEVGDVDTNKNHQQKLAQSLEPVDDKCTHLID